jgi:hypothetical protein
MENSRGSFQAVERSARSKCGAMLRLGTLLGVVAVFSVGCSKEKGPIDAGDTLGPAAIIDVAAIDSTCVSITVAWTSPSEDGLSGGATSSYDIRYRNQSVEDSSWDRMTQVEGEPTPAAPGMRQSYDLTGLLPGERYVIQMKSMDDAGNASEPSNTESHGTNAGDCIAPGAIHDLTAAYVSTTSATLTWTAPADDGLLGGRVASYDLRALAGTLDAGSWSLADTVPGEPVPGDPGAAQSCVIEGLSTDTEYQVAIRSLDDEGNTSQLSNLCLLRTLAVPDTIPPARVIDLAVRDLNAHRIRLVWSASGDDSLTGRARVTEVRMAIGGAFDWNTAGAIGGVPEPGDPGSPDSLTVGGLAPDVVFTFAVRILDDAGNASVPSEPLHVTPPQPTVREFVDPRGICHDASSGDLLVADHGGALFQFDSLGGKSSAASIPEAVSVRTETNGNWYAISGEEFLADGKIWRLSSLQPTPQVVRTDLHGPRSLVIIGSDVVVIEAGPPPTVKRYAPGGSVSVLPAIVDGDPIGIAADAQERIFVGVNRTNGTAVVRSIPSGGTAWTNVYFLPTGGSVGDIAMERSGAAFWVLDTAHSNVTRVSLDGQSAGTISRSLRSPVAISEIPNSRFLAYASRDGFVLRALRLQ